MLFVTCDTHLGHENIKKFCNRPDNFESLIEKNWNDTVGKDDTIIHSWMREDTPSPRYGEESRPPFSYFFVNILNINKIFSKIKSDGRWENVSDCEKSTQKFAC